MKRVLVIAATMCAGGVLACSDSSVGPVAPLTPASTEDARFKVSDAVFVTNSRDDGHGSFRDAIEEANANSSIERVVFAPHLHTIALKSTVEFTGAQALEIDGNSATLDASALTDTSTAFLANGGGDLSLKGLTVRGAPGSGITVEVPPASTGIKKVTLTGVIAFGNQGHGIVINDQAFPDSAGDPDLGTLTRMEGSAASVHVTVVASSFEKNGFGALDRDGLRVNEGGDGNLVFSASLTSAEGNGADGIELDERGPGDAQFTIVASRLIGNGSFDTSADPDLDDGIDVDESGEGSLIGKVLLTSANDNLEEGFDFNENNAGDFKVDMTLVEANGNREEGIDFEEDDDFAGGGDLVTKLVGIKVNGNGPLGDAALKVREKGVGNLDATVTGIEASGNQYSGIQIREDAAGNLVANISNATTSGNTAGDDSAGNGIDFDENSTGDLTATLTNSTSSNNAAFGVRADNAGAGVGTLQLTNVTLTANGSGPTGGGGVTVTQSP